jgi:hypothetical protein
VGTDLAILNEWSATQKLSINAFWEICDGSPATRIYDALIQNWGFPGLLMGTGITTINLNVRLLVISGFPNIYPDQTVLAQLQEQVSD